MDKIKKTLFVWWYFITINVFLIGCNKSEPHIENKIRNEDDILSKEKTELTTMPTTDFDDIIESASEYMEWIDNSRLVIDIDNYGYLESYVQFIVEDNKEVKQNSFVGKYELKITIEGTMIEFDNAAVETDDPLYKILSELCPEWDKIELKSKIKAPVLTIKDGEVIRTVDPADYLKEN